MNRLVELYGNERFKDPLEILQDAARRNPHNLRSLSLHGLYSAGDDCSALYLSHMNHQLSELDWQELTDLITDAPPERVRLAVSRVNASCAPAAQLMTAVDRLLHLATISSGDAFDRALLGELRRLSIH